jgi:hypothetical protein
MLISAACRLPLGTYIVDQMHFNIPKHTVPVFDLGKKFIFIWPAENFRNSLKIDAEKVVKHYYAVMDGNGTIYHVKYVSPKISKISENFFWFRRKGFLIHKKLLGVQTPRCLNQRPVRYKEKGQLKCWVVGYISHCILKEIAQPLARNAYAFRPYCQ